MLATTPNATTTSTTSIAEIAPAERGWEGGAEAGVLPWVGVIGGVVGGGVEGGGTSTRIHIHTSHHAQGLAVGEKEGGAISLHMHTETLNNYM